MSLGKMIWLATPHGQDGMGGIDRLNDAIVEAMHARPDLGFICVRLVTRGKRGLIFAQIVFARALTVFLIAAWRGQIDLLHVHLSDRGSSYRKMVLGRLARLLRVPYVLHLHGVYLREFWSEGSPFMRAELRRLFLGSQSIVVLGHYWRDVILQGVPEVASRITVLPNGTTAVARPAGRREKDERRAVHITFLGQLGARKGVPELVKALRSVAGLENWTATIAGDGDVAATRASIAQAGLAGRVAIPGWLGEPERTRLLAGSDILVLPSHAENLPMVIVEAFAHGLAVIATPVGAVPEMVADGCSGLLVPPGDDVALAKAIERLVLDTNLRKSLGAAAVRTHADRYDFAKYIDRLANIWREAIGASSTDQSPLGSTPSPAPVAPASRQGFRSASH